ncbi:hypothetical protein CHU92_06565 [Flavobacterium cyanobacteriorum]|uniref:Response regulatory domain-containing protein n=1 Tax=Flavobacterium cyanobacteriorum TaxID=2022802 RepID=A0A255Z9K6_9FLAO|nr:response regulator [Flavobacterium cyanobacteriorum]OYQ38126.1 hypothetical protein CHU92_06565 [Flavobacterium cyanobacteriorum]
MQLFIIDWSREKTTPLIDYCKKTRHKVLGAELLDGAEAYRKTGSHRPDAIVINYAVKPSHGRAAASEIKKRKATSEIPIYFIGGTEDDNEKVSHLGICLSEEEFRDFLDE